MKNVILGMLAKISKLDAETKKLTARIEAQSLLISALVLAIGKNGGVTSMVESANQAINTVIESAEADEILKSDAALLLSEFQELLSISKLVEQSDIEIDEKGLSEVAAAAEIENKA